MTWTRTVVAVALTLVASAAYVTGCGPDEAPPLLPPDLLIPPGEADHTVTTSVGSGEAAAVELRFFTISELHRGFFSDPRFVGALGTELGDCVDGTAQVLISYDNETRIGRLVLKVPPDQLGCLPQMQGNTVNLDSLAPVGVALANYRDAIAENFDYRVASFRVGLSFTRGAKQCNLQIAGQHPPDGRRWSPCVGFAGQDRCGEGSKRDGVTSLEFSGKDAAYLNECFRR